MSFPPPEITADGSYTFFSSEYGEAYHSRSGAKLEAEKKFVAACQLARQAQEKNHLFLLDICYGLGYNTAAALATIWQINPQCFVTLLALEIDGEVPRQALAANLLDTWGKNLVKILQTLSENSQVKTPHLDAHLYLGDARQIIPKLAAEKFLADAIFLDPFSPTKCPQLWSVEFLTLVAKCLNPKGILATYSCAASVRSALKLAGLSIAPSLAVGRRSPGTIATFDPTDLPPLSAQESEHLQTLAAIPYRDPSLSDSPRQILQRRVAEQEESSLEKTSHWKKRWQVFCR